MKRSSIIIRDDFRIGAQAAAAQALGMADQPAIGWTMMFAVTLAVLVFGTIWYG